MNKILQSFMLVIFIFNNVVTSQREISKNNYIWKETGDETY